MRAVTYHTCPECECHEKEGRGCVVPGASGVRIAVCILGDVQKEVARVEWCEVEFESEEFGEPGRAMDVVRAKKRRWHVRLCDIELRDGEENKRGYRYV